MSIRRDDLDKLIGRHMRALRTARRMSLAKLASRLGVSYQQVQKYERGQNRIAAGTLYLVARIFKVSFETFFIGIMDNSPSASATTAGRPKQETCALSLPRK